MSRTFWLTNNSNIGAMAAVVKDLDIVRKLLDNPHDAELYANVTNLLKYQAKEHKLEHFLLTNSTKHVIWSVHPDSKLVSMALSLLVGCFGHLKVDSICSIPNPRQL